MIYYSEKNRYDVYVIVSAEGYHQLVELSFARSTLNEENPRPSILVFKTIFEQIPDNCGDKIKATQKLLVIVCTKNGALNIFRREDMLMLANEQVSDLLTGQDIGVVELNTNLKKIGI